MKPKWRPRLPDPPPTAYARGNRTWRKGSSQRGLPKQGKNAENDSPAGDAMVRYLERNAASVA